MTAVSKAQDSEGSRSPEASMWYLQMFSITSKEALAVSHSHPTRLAISILEACKDRVHTGTSSLRNLSALTPFSVT